MTLKTKLIGITKEYKTIVIVLMINLTTKKTFTITFQKFALSNSSMLS